MMTMMMMMMMMMIMKQIVFDCVCATTFSYTPYVLGSHLGTGSNTQQVYKGPIGR